MSDLYTFTIFPLELIYKYIYLALYLLIHDYGLALLSLSLLNYFMLMPLNKLVRGISETENQLQQILTPQLQKIKESSSGDVRHQRIQNLYGRYSYHPIYALRNVLPLLIQLPFLMAVYFMVSSLPDLDSVSFLFISNLAQPDGILWGINLLPIVMTLVSLLNACFIVKLSANQKKQAVFVALVFLVLLYNAPSALLVYWTMNNVLILFFGLLAKTRPIQSIVQSLSEVKEKCIPSLLDSSGLFLALCFCVPLYFTLSLNSHMFHSMQISNLFIFIVAVCFGFLLLGIIFDKLIKLCASCYVSPSLPFILSIKNDTPRNPWLHFYIKDVFFIIIAFVGLYCCTVLCIDLRLHIDSSNTRNILRLILIGLFFLFSRQYGFKILNTTLLSLLFFSSLQFSYQQRSDSLLWKEVTEHAFNSFPLDEKLHQKTNIYLVLLESYMSPTTIRETYGHDNSAFEHELSEKGFQIYDNLFSNSSFTNGSLLNLFMMQADMSAFFTGNSDVTAEAHQILGGSNDNLLYSYLKKNGYIISSYYEKQKYYYTVQGNLLDYTIEEPSLSFLGVLEEISPYFYSKLSTHPSLHNIVYKDVYAPSFKHIQKIKELNQPSFFLIKPLNKLHMTYELNTLASSYEDWIASGIYQKGIDEMNQELLQLLGVIEKNDPDALIVLIGDHGHKFIIETSLNLDIFQGWPTDIKAECRHLNVSSEEILEDFCSVFLAIRMPKSAKGKITVDSQYSYADLFRHIFAALDDNPVYLENKSEDISVNNVGLLLRKGNKIFENAEQANKK